MKRRISCLTALLIVFCLLLNQSALALAAPVAENQEISTYRGISVGGTLVAVTPDGGPVSFRITTEPSKGSVELGENGEFVYTPNEKSRGRDYFGYRATDSSGQESREATVIIRLCRQKTKLRYADTKGESCDYAAHALAEAGLFRGAELQGQAMFEPEREMNRGEFLSLCMACADAKLLCAVDNTGYADDAALSTWLKPYVATALLEGYGSSSECSGVGDPITWAEAGELINACFGITDIKCEEDQMQSAANLRACGLWSDQTGQEPTAVLTRSEGARMLVAAMSLREK